MSRLINSANERSDLNSGSWPNKAVNRRKENRRIAVMMVLMRDMMIPQCYFEAAACFVDAGSCVQQILPSSKGSQKRACTKEMVKTE